MPRDVRSAGRWPVLILLAFLLVAVPMTALGSSDSPVPADLPPVANAGPDQTVNEDAPMTFDASGSTDDVGIVNYTWILPGLSAPPRTLFRLASSGYPGAFDPVRPLLYVVDGQKVDAVNLSTGAVDRSFGLSHTPQYSMTLAVSPGGEYLVVALPTGSRGYYYFGPYDSFLATVDLVNQTKVGEFFLPQDANSAGVSDDGYAVVSGGSGQWADIRVYNVRNGSALPQEGSIWQYNYLTMHPSGRRIYIVETAGLSTLILQRTDFNTSAGVTTGYSWPYWGSDPGQRVFASPRGDRLVTGSGMLLALDDNASRDMTYIYRLLQGSVTAAAFDYRLDLMAIVEGSTLNFFDANTYERLSWVDLGGVPAAITFRGDEVLALVGNEVRAVAVPRGFLFGVTPSYTFTEPGDYDVTLRVRDTANHTGTDSVTITVRDITAPIPVAGPDWTGIHGATVAFDGTLSWDNVGIASYAWTLDDGGPLTLWGPTASHRFDSVGTYVVTLTVTDFAGNSGQDTMVVTSTLDGIPPTTVAGPAQTVFKGTLVEFDGTGSRDNIGIASYAWTFDDNGTKTLQGARTSYRFLNPGVFTVTLTVTDLDGNRATDTVAITVQDIVLVPYAHPSRGFRIGIPEGWVVRLDTTVGGSRADLAAFGPMIGLRETDIFVTSGAASDAQETQDYLLGAANSLIAQLRAQALLVVTRQPQIVETRTSRAALFEVEFAGTNLHEVVAVVASESRQRVYTIVAQIDADSADRYLPLFEAVIGSFEVLPLAPLEDPAVVGGIVLGIVALILSVVAILAWRHVKRMPKKPASQPPPASEPAPAPPSVAWALPTAPAVESAPAVQGWPYERPSFCMECGTMLESADRFCPECGTKTA